MGKFITIEEIEEKLGKVELDNDVVSYFKPWTTVTTIEKSRIVLENIKNGILNRNNFTIANVCSLVGLVTNSDVLEPVWEYLSRKDNKFDELPLHLDKLAHNKYRLVTDKEWEREHRG